MIKMKCKIDSANLLNWSRMITTLTSIGDEEVHFSFTDSTLTLTVFDASMSVSGIVTFFNNFFQVFHIPRGYCKTFKLPAKCILNPFRSPRFIKSCIFCEIAFEDEKDDIVVTMGCKSLTEIKYTIKLLDNSDEMHTDHDPDRLANWIRTDPKFMISNLSNFSHAKGLVDLTIKAEGNKLLMKNRATDLMRREGKIYTELALSTLAFDRFTINEDTEVTFQLRDFKTFIALAEHMKLAMTIHFHGPQDPVMVCVRSEQLEATLVLATKYVPEVDLACMVNASQASSSSAMSNIISNVSSAGPSQVPVPIPVGRKEKTNRLNPIPTPQNDPEDRENEGDGTHPPPRKRMRDLLAKVNVAFDPYKKFPGHDIVLVEASDEECSENDF